MAGFTVPNASEYGTTIQSLDQAEPDSLDFRILGNSNHGVLSGADITIYSAGNGSAALTAAEVYVNSHYGYVSSGTLTFTAPNVDARFDLICVEKSGTSFFYTTVVGTPSAVNPIFPSVTDNQTVLFALYRKSGETFDAKSCVDKRVFLETIIRSGSSAPSAAAEPGDLYFKTGTPAVEQSSLYVYSDDTGWQNIAKYEGVREEPLHPFLFAGI
jgi:hypothetical protein